MAWKAEDDVTRALGSFQKAIEIDPRLGDALSEIRVLSARKERGGDGGKGLFDRLRKK